MPRLILLVMLGLTTPALFGQTTNTLAPGGPGADAHWETAAKNGFGTSTSSRSKVWFTLANGALTEVFYPTLDTPNTQILQFVVCSQGTCFSEADDMDHSMEIPDPKVLSFRQTNRARRGQFIIRKTYITDPERPSVLINVSLSSSHTPYEVYLYYDPSLNNSGMHDTAWRDRQALLSKDGNICSALIADSGFEETTNEFLQSPNDLHQINKSKLNDHYDRAENGNVVQLAKLPYTKRFTVILSFGKNSGEAYANAYLSLSKGFERLRREYSQGWHQYVAKLHPVSPASQNQFDMSAMVLKGLEDKTYPGAIIASPSNPWGAGANANEPNSTGYHAVWSRDLYHCATALVAMGDRAAADRALNYLFNVQQRSDGSFPQNTHVDGRVIGGAVQMDQTAFPIVLAHQLNRTDRETWSRHIKPAADFIAARGPSTEQERWEEESGYSPATIAAEIAGLVCAADIATVNKDQEAAKRYLRVADAWVNKVETWTATNSGSYSPLSYYLRGSQKGDPNEGARLEINSGGGVFDEREIVDAGFLELVRLGIKAPNDPTIVRSLAVVDRLLRVNTPKGEGWYRYNHDAYGETANGGPYDGRSGRGRLWTFLTGERGEYELARGNKRRAGSLLATMRNFANDGRMLPEQVWDRSEESSSQMRFGEGTGSATPLAWSMAQFVRLAVNLNSGSNVETPADVTHRYQEVLFRKQRYTR